MPNVCSLLAEVKEWQNLLRIGCPLVVRQSVHSPTWDGSKPTYATGWGEDWLSELTTKNMNHNMEIYLETPQIRCANIITMENATCNGACCLVINRSADEQHLLKHS